MGDPGCTAFILENTVIAVPPLCPELRLYLITDACPLWRAGTAELERLELPPPYWAFAWAGGQALARFILDNVALLAGKRVLDLGAGSGLTAIAAMKAGAAETLAADIDRLALAAVLLNASQNGVVVRTTAEDLLAKPAEAWDVVLVGDLFYERALAEHVTRFIDEAAAGGALILIGDPQRNYFP